MIILSTFKREILLPAQNLALTNTFKTKYLSLHGCFISCAYCDLRNFFYLPYYFLMAQGKNHSQEFIRRAFRELQ